MVASAPSASLDSQIPAHSDNVEEELQRVQLALNAVYSSSNDSASTQWWAQRQLADRYLTSFQGSSISWMVCDRLLQENDSSNPQDKLAQQQRRFFAAQTLHTKCRVDVHELPESSLPSLRDSLLSHLQRYAAFGDAALTTRLAMSTSALAVQMRWTTILTDVLENVTVNKEPVMLTFLLRALPEECASDRLILIDDSNRFAMRDHLIASAPVVFQFFQSNMRDIQPNRVLEAFHAWIRYVPVRPAALVESPLLQASLQALAQKDYLEHAADVVVEVLRMYPSHHYGNEVLVNAMIPLLSSLPLDDALRSNDEDVLRAYCRVVTEMGESYMSLILSNQHAASSKVVVEWVLRCSSIPDAEIASITLHFWYRMVVDMEMIEPFDWRQELVDVYTPHLLKLIEVCVRNLMRYPIDFSDFADDQADDIHRHRFYVAETMEDCCRLLGGQSVLHQLGSLLRDEVAVASNRHQMAWHGIESALMCITSIHQFVPSDETEVLPYCFQLIPQLPGDITPLRVTASKLIGRFAAWLAMHHELLHPLLPYLAQALSVADCAPAAAVAIKELCECSNQSFSIAEPVMQLYQEKTAQPGLIDVGDELQILEGVCRALSRQIQDTRTDGNGFLGRLVEPIGHRLAASISEPNPSLRRIIPEIERITVIVQFLSLPSLHSERHPIVDLISSLWPLLDAATSRFPSDNVLAEKICRLHKHVIRTCGANAYAPMFDAMAQQMVKSFQESHQSPFLYAASICITEYGNTAGYADKLFEMVAAMATTTFSFLLSLEDLTNHPDVVEEFFYLMSRMVGYCPYPLVKSPLMQLLFRFATVGMQLDHHGANKGTLKFLENTMTFGLSLRERNNPDCQRALEQSIAQEGQAIVANLVRAIMGELPSYSNQIPEILWKMNLLCPGLLASWLQMAFDLVTLPERAKTDFMGALNTGLARDEFSLAVRAFQSACERERRFRKAHRRS